MLKPYIGVTGFTYRHQVRQALSHFPTCGRKLMVGVLASKKTIKHQPPDNPNRYPSWDALPGIFNHDPRALNLVHYNTNDLHLADDLTRIWDWCSPLIHGFQLNIPWPSVRALESFLSKNSDAVIVLQIGQVAMSITDYRNERMAFRLRSYDGLVSYVLVDSSGGNSQWFNVDTMMSTLLAIRKAGVTAKLAVAGGLKADNVQRVQKLLDKYPDLSFETESRVRDFADQMSMLDVAAYLQASGNLSFAPA